MGTTYSGRRVTSAALWGCILVLAMTLPFMGGCDSVGLPIPADGDDISTSPDTNNDTTPDDPSDDQVLGSDVDLPLSHPRSQPTSLTTTVLGPGAVEMNWIDNAADEDGFLIQRSNNQEDWTDLATADKDVTTYTDSSVVAEASYCYRVLAFNATSQTLPTEASCATLPPSSQTDNSADPVAAPSSLAVTAPASDRAELTWQDNSTNEQGFIVRRYSVTDGWVDLTTVGAGVATYTDTQVIAGTSYCYRVLAFAGTNQSPETEQVCVVVPKTADPGGTTEPSTDTVTTPSNLTVTVPGSDKTELAWIDNSTNEDGFIVQRYSSSSGWVDLAKVGANVVTYADTQVTAGTSYCYRILAFAGTIKSKTSLQICVVIPKATDGTTEPPSDSATAPSDLTVSAPESDRVTLAWKDNSTNEDGFIVQRYSATDGWIDLATVAANEATYTDMQVAAGTGYCYRVMAYTGTSKSKTTSQICVVVPKATNGTTEPPVDPINAPTKLVVTAPASDRVELVWQDNSTNEDGFIVQRYAAASGWVDLATVGANVATYADTQVTAGTSYCYRVLAYLDTRRSSGTAQICVAVPKTTNSSGTTDPPADEIASPSNLTVTAPASDRVELAWKDNSSNEEGFLIRRYSGTDGWINLATAGAEATTYTDTQVIAQAIYCYQVSAFLADRQSPGMIQVCVAVPKSDDPGATTDPPIDSITAPSNLIVTAPASDRVELAWQDNSSNEEGFVIRRYSATDGWMDLTTVNADISNYTDTQVATETSYCYAILAFADTRQSPQTAQVCVAVPKSTDPGQTPVDPVTAPGELIVVVSGSDKAELAWKDNSSNEDGFIVQRYAAAGGWVDLATIGTGVITYTDTQVTPDSAYCYRIIAFAGTTLSSASSQVCVAIPRPPEPPVDPVTAPSDLTVTVPDSDRAELAWRDNSSNEDGFIVQRYAATGGWVDLATVGAGLITYTDTQITPESGYCYRVLAFAGTDLSSATSQVCVVIPKTTGPVLPPADPITAPGNLTVTVPSNDKVELAWQDNSSNEAGFIVQRYTAVGGWVDHATVSAGVTVYTDTQITPESGYCYRVLAFAGTDRSSETSQVCVVIPKSTDPDVPPVDPIAAPTNLVVTAPASDRVELSWQDNSSNEDGFIVQRYTAASGWVDLVTRNVAVVTYTDTQVTAGGSYCYRVLAFADNRRSSTTSQVCVVVPKPSAPAGQGKEYFVAPSGQDSQAGTSLQTALKTIQTAVAKLQPGDTLTIAPGEYEQRFTISQKATVDKPITIRAAVPGFSVIRASAPTGAFQQVAGKRFVWVTPSAKTVYRVIELDTDESYLEAPALIDMDQFRPSFFYDAQNKKLYVHTSDGRPPDQHQCVASVLPGPGIKVDGEYIRIEGLVVQGFYTDYLFDYKLGYGIAVAGRFNEVRQCSFFQNGGGVVVNARNCIVRDSLFAGNYSPNMPQLYITGSSDTVQVFRNTVMDAPTHGIRAYEVPSNITITNNVVKNAVIGIDYKASEGVRIARGNVVTGCTYLNWNSGTNVTGITEDANTFATPSYWEKVGTFAPGAHTLTFASGKDDPKFADPDHLDYRLQADSPSRGSGPGGTDLGAFSYSPDVFFVAPGGSDSRDGLCIARAFATIGRALAVAQPGATIYILPGRYNETVRPALSGTAGKTIIIRGRGKGIMPSVAGIDLTARSYVQIENLQVTGPVAIRQASNINIEKCFLTDAEGEGVVVADAAQVWLRQLTLWNASGPAVSVKGDCPNLKITSCILNCRSGPILSVEGTAVNGMFREYNNYAVASNQQVGIIGGQAIADITSLASLGSGDRYSISADPKFVVVTESPAITIASSCAARGELFGNIGAGELHQTPLPPVVTDVRICETTPHTASLVWWTPNVSSKTRLTPNECWEPYPVHAEVRYGVSTALGTKAHSFGDLYHRVTLRDLRPDTTYYYKIVILDRPWVDKVSLLYEPLAGDYNWPGGESAVLTFKTPAENTWLATPRKFYVSPSGNSANSGLSETAPSTLTAISDQVRAGDTVILLDGVYQEMFAPAATGVPGAPITLKAKNTGRACLDGSTFIRPSAVALFWKDQIIIDGVVMRRFADRNHGRRAGLFDCQVLSMRCGDVTLRNCVLVGWQFACTETALLARGGHTYNINNCVITGFMNAVNIRDVDQANLLGNTWYVPTITNMFITGNHTLKNNLFFGQEKQKVFQYAPMVSSLQPTVSNYNAYYFGTLNTVRYIGYGIQHTTETNMGGLARIQKELNIDLNSLEPALADVQITGPAPNNYFDDIALGAFARQIAEGTLVPTIGMFTPPANSRLNTMGENGAAIGARPVVP